MKTNTLGTVIVITLFIFTIAGCATTVVTKPPEPTSTPSIDAPDAGAGGAEEAPATPAPTKTPGGVTVGGFTSGKGGITTNPHANDTYTVPTPQNGTDENVIDEGTQGEPVKEEVIRIMGKHYIPDTIAITVGTKVTWKNEDMVAGRTPVIHMVVEHHNAFRSGQFKPGESWSFLFNTTGTYTYMDPIFKETMRGIIIVN